MSDADHRLLEAGTHHEPHRYLGLHTDAEGPLLRVYRPDADGVRLCDATAPLELTAAGGGLFWARPAQPPARPYELEFRRGTVRWTGADPYAFAPTLGELDLHLIGEGQHRRLWRALGARVIEHEGITGTAFTVWAPSAAAVSVIGDWNGWDPRIHPLRTLGASGVWELFLPTVAAGARYKFALRTADGRLLEKADPLARRCEAPPATASIVAGPSAHRWSDAAHLAAVADSAPHRAPISIYEVHLPSWRRRPTEGDRPLSYRELGEELGDYVAELGFTHVELLPVMGHPFAGSWGYQVTSYYAPAPAGGEPDDLRALIDALHRRGLGVILDWVPAHFPKDEFALARFDGSHLYEHADPRRGEHPDWGTLVFNHGRNEVRNFLVANGLYWLEEFHADGLRVDAVASMLYRDYSRPSGEWVPNPAGGREDEEAISFLRELNTVTHGELPGRIVAAEESTAWPAVSRPVSAGGLGFDFKWNMGWMHDTLQYFGRDPVHRAHHHDELTFGLVYAFSEQFILPLSHDEVVHGKGSLLGRMPGDEWQRHANLRALYGFMWAHPGKQLLFMGGEFAQSAEWNHERSLDWHLLQYDLHAGCRRLVGDLNHRYREHPALWQIDGDPAGFSWLVADDRAANVFAFARFADDGPPVVAVANLAPVPRHDYRLPLPIAGTWSELINTDAREYGGGGIGNGGQIQAEEHPWGDRPCSALLTLPPLAVLWLTPKP